MKLQIAEVRNGYTDDQNYTYIDVWETTDDDEEGKTVAIVCRDTKKVFFLDNLYTNELQVTEAIQEVLKYLNGDTRVKIIKLTNEGKFIDWIIINSKTNHTIADTFSTEKEAIRWAEYNHWEIVE